MGKLRPPSWGSEGTGPGIGGFRQPCPLLLQLPPTGPLLWQKGTAAAEDHSAIPWGLPRPVPDALPTLPLGGGWWGAEECFWLSIGRGEGRAVLSLPSSPSPGGHVAGLVEGGGSQDRGQPCGEEGVHHQG